MTNFHDSPYESSEFLQILQKGSICNEALLRKPVFRFLLNKIKDEKAIEKIAKTDNNISCINEEQEDEEKSNIYVVVDEVKNSSSINLKEGGSKIKMHELKKEKQNPEPPDAKLAKKRLSRKDRRGTIIHK